MPSIHLKKKILSTLSLKNINPTNLLKNLIEKDWMYNKVEALFANLHMKIQALNFIQKK